MAWTGNKEAFCVLESAKIAKFDICLLTKGGHIEHLYGSTQNLSNSPSVNMLSFGVTIPVTVPQRSELPEGLMNNPVYVRRTNKMHTFLINELIKLYCLRQLNN
jgi:hypothetical protein